MNKKIIFICLCTMVFLLFSSCKDSKTKDAKVDLSLKALVGEGSSFGYAKWPFGATTENDIFTETGTEKKDWLETENDPYSLSSQEGKLSFSDMNEDSAAIQFQFSDETKQQLVKYTVSLLYDEKEVYEQDLKLLQDYIADAYPDADADALGGSGWIGGDNTYCLIENYRFGEWNGEGEWRIEIGIFKNM